MGNELLRSTTTKPASEINLVEDSGGPERESRGCLELHSDQQLSTRGGNRGAGSRNDLESLVAAGDAIGR
jgi:hypothetical protein